MSRCCRARWCGLSIGLLVAVVSGAPAAGANRAHPQSRHVVVLVNEAAPESVALGEHYARARGIPTDHICRLRTSTSETIDRGTFDREILLPVREFLATRRLVTRRGKRLINRAHYIVPVYGVPVRVSARPTPKDAPKRKFPDRASVDSELTLVLQTRAPSDGVLRNPYFKQKAPFSACRLRVKHNPRAVPLSSAMCLVTRLDGPSPDVVRRMIDDAIATEQAGLAGKVYVDLRGITKGAYAKGDQWLRGAADRLKKAGYGCDVENTGKLIPADRNLPDAAVYLGWYTGNAYGRFLDPTFRFTRGAIAYHLHSFSASVVRTDRKRWVGPLLARGAAVTIGHVYEPYLGFTTRVDVFVDRLLAGRNFAEAAYASIPALSWQSVFLGDPLYCPFAVRKPVHTRPADPSPSSRATGRR